MENKNFENKMKQLEEYVSGLENNNLPLQESIDLYEKAMSLSKELTKELEEASKKVKIISEEE